MTLQQATGLNYFLVNVCFLLVDFPSSVLSARHRHVYTAGHTVKDGKRRLPNRRDPLRPLDESSVLKRALGEDVVASCIKLRHAQWNEHAGHLAEWERQTTLDRRIAEVRP